MGLWIINGISWDYLGKLCCDLTAPEKVFFAKAIYLVRFKIAFLTVDIVPLGIALPRWSSDFLVTVGLNAFWHG